MQFLDARKREFYVGTTRSSGRPSLDTASSRQVPSFRNESTVSSSPFPSATSYPLMSSTPSSYSRSSNLRWSNPQGTFENPTASSSSRSLHPRLLDRSVGFSP